MLTIKRVATVVSNYQEETPDKSDGGGCGRNCLAACCLPSSRLPLYAFKNHVKNRHRYQNQPKNCSPNPTEDTKNTRTSPDQSAQRPPSIFLHNLLLSEWEDRLNRGLFRYDVTSCQTKVIPGRYGFVVQLNEGRHLKKRPTEFRIDEVLQPFDDSKFNFTKVGQEEVLFRFEDGGDDAEESPFFPAAAVAGDGSPNVLAINVSPIEYGHVLLIPRVLDRLPQRIDHESFFLAMKLAQEATDPFFRVAYNSLGAFATINHLHFQAYYLPLPFPVEKASTQRIITENLGACSDRGVVVSCLLNYPVRGFVFSGGDTIRDLSEAVSSSCVWLQENNVPFNVLISECGKRVFVFTQCYAEKQARGEASQKLLETQVNPAAWEIGGHIVLKRREDFENASESSACELLAEASLSEKRFEYTKRFVLEAAGLGFRV